ncbi:hypothetical protein D3C81_205490 [compost metagenome]
MTTWADAPKIQGPPQTEDIAVLLSYVKKLADVTAKMAKDLEFILNGNVAFDNIQANGIEAKNIKAGAVIAEKIDVNELSAISANLGHITAGLIEAISIYGSYIATAQAGVYPRSEMSNTDKMFKVASSVARSISMEAWGGTTSTPVQRFDSDNLTAVVYPLPNALAIITVGGQGDIQINSGQDLYLSAAYEILIPSWGKLTSQASGGNLQDYLDWLDGRITALGG